MCNLRGGLSANNLLRASCSPAPSFLPMSVSSFSKPSAHRFAPHDYCSFSDRKVIICRQKEIQEVGVVLPTQHCQVSHRRAEKATFCPFSSENNQALHIVQPKPGAALQCSLHVLPAKLICFGSLQLNSQVPTFCIV